MRAIPYVILGMLALLALPFAHYAAGFGWRGLTRDLSGESYLFRPHQGAAPVLLSAHMIAGAVLTLGVFAQLLPQIRAHAPVLHRWSGRLLVVGAIITALGGLAFIWLRGTIGGGWMDAGFALYGALMLLTALNTLRFARAGDTPRHRDWALRLFVLAIGSWLYRVHYGLWYAATDGWASNAAFTGTFDRIQVFAFYLPYLAALEVMLWRQRRTQLREAAPARG